MRNELNFLFNTDKYYNSHIVPSIKNNLKNIKYATEDLLVYQSDKFEIMITDEGNVFISTDFSDNISLKNGIMDIVKEYNKLNQIDKRFEISNSFKVVVPKEMKTDFIKVLDSKNYNFRPTNDDSFTFTVYN